MTSWVFLLDFYGFVFCPKMVIFVIRSFSIKNLSEFSKIIISIFSSILIPGRGEFSKTLKLKLNKSCCAQIV